MRGAAHLELQNEKERSLRMSSLIGFILDPKSQSREELSRSALLSELVSKGIMSCASQEVKDPYNLLERDFLTLDLASKVQPLLTKISKLGGKLSSASSVTELQLSQYVPGLEKMATLRLLQQVSHVYQMIKIEALSRMIPFFYFSVVEKISVDAIKYNCIAVEFDHFKSVAFFGNSDLESDRLRVHLTIIAESLNKVRSLIYPPVKKASKLGNTLPVLADIVDKEHKRLLARKAIIEKLKEEQEQHMLEMEREEESKRLKLEKLMEEAEKKRLASDSNEREAQRIQREVVQRDLDDAQILLEEVVKRSKMKGKKPVIKGEVTRDALIELARAEQLRERQEMEKKLLKLVKTMDYMERAKREEEIPLIEAAFQKFLMEEKILHEREQQQEIDLSRQRHAGDLQGKRRLVRMLDNKIMFQDRIFRCRKAEFSKLQEESICQIRNQKETKRKMLFFLRTEEDRQKKVHEEEEARTRKGVTCVP